MSPPRPEARGIVGRVRWRAWWIAAAAIAVAFAIRWRSGLSLTITAAVVIFSFLVLEKVTQRLGPRQAKPGFRALAPLLLVTGGSFVILAVVLWRWKGFDAVAGAAGLSVVVLAIVPEIWAKE